MQIIIFIKLLMKLLIIFCFDKLAMLTKLIVNSIYH